MEVPLRGGKHVGACTRRDGHESFTLQSAVQTILKGMASAPARPGAVDLQAHLGSQLRFIRGNLARLDRSASNRGLTADESRELSFCKRMLGAVRPFKNADTDLQNAKLFWEVHDLLVTVGENAVERSRAEQGGAGNAVGVENAEKRGLFELMSFISRNKNETTHKTEWSLRARGAAAPAASCAEEDEEMDRVLNARFQSMGPSHADLGI